MIPIGTAASDLDTPCLLVDLDLMEGNIRRMQSVANANGVKLRPHVKTHKTPDIAKMQIAAGATGIAVAKVSEAEVFVAAGHKDITIPYPVIGSEKWRRVADLAHDCRITVGVESEVGARGLSAAAVAVGVTVRAQVEVDIGLHRCGVRPEDAEGLCRLIASLPGLELDGIYGYRSAFLTGSNAPGLEELGKEEGEQLVAIAERLRSTGLRIDNVVGGSTPTAPSVAQVPGITEIRPGTYLFGDYTMAKAGVIGFDAIALSVLCTVVSRPGPDRATVDGGSKTFSSDRYPRQDEVAGYARTVDGRGYIDRLTEEHGMVRLEPGTDLKVGDKIAFYPMHVCSAVNLSDEIMGIRKGRVETVWQVAARGKRT